MFENKVIYATENLRLNAKFTCIFARNKICASLEAGIEVTAGPAGGSRNRRGAHYTENTGS